MTGLNQSHLDEETLASMALDAVGSENHYIDEIVIDGDWARVDAMPKNTSEYQGEEFYYHRVEGQWTYILSGTGVFCEDIPAAPASIFPY